MLLTPYTVSSFRKLFSFMILSVLIDRRHSFIISMLVYYIWGIKKSLSKRFLKETLTSFTLVFRISLLNQVAIDCANVENVIP